MRDAMAHDAGAYPQQRVLKNAPREVARDDLAALYGAAMSYW